MGEAPGEGVPWEGVRIRFGRAQSRRVGDERGGAPKEGLSRRMLLAGVASAFGGGLLVKLARGPADIGGRSADIREGAPEGARAAAGESWEAVRAQFELDPSTIHLAGMLIASHPEPVRLAIERHRRGLDRNPARYVLENDTPLRLRAVRAAGKYFGTDPACVALTDSTTMGLSVLYRGLSVREGEEILTTTHDHYSTWAALDAVAERRGARIRKITLYEDPSTVSASSVVERLAEAIGPETRVLALTWVHSDTGVKLPIREIGEMVSEVNGQREPGERILYCVDGVHGFGVEDEEMGDLGCDFLVAGCHKWLYGPRGTGVVYSARPEGWQNMTPLIPPFGVKNTPGLYFSPGGFHAFEHRWALTEAFEFHASIGKERIRKRIHALAGRLKEGIASLPRAKLHTPMSSKLSAGIVSFEFEGVSAQTVVDRLRQEGIVLSLAPYGLRCIRATPTLANTPEEIERVLRALHPFGRV